ncbi:hypothetical protein [Dolichospermum compactum]|uniref:hypothetical protein n=1 Tax=Dolichospermum compactum TaxID=136073 RepID=UPI0012FD9E24|nr:hypothetical protein [Dolichospermum compactum]
MWWLSESGLPGFKDVQDLIDFLPDKDKYNIPSFPTRISHKQCDRNLYNPYRATVSVIFHEVVFDAV